MKEPLDVGTPLTYSERTVMFRETPVFTNVLPRYLHDDQYRLLQEHLVEDPEDGDLVVGAHGLRKLRWKVEGRGKRGGVRVIYYWATQDRIIVMAFMYSKKETGDLTPKQYKALADYIRSEFP